MNVFIEKIKFESAGVVVGLVFSLAPVDWLSHDIVSLG